MEAGAARGTVEFHEDIRRVMVAVDEHEGSVYALEWTLKKLHDSIINSNLVIFTAQPSSEFSYIHAVEPREVRREIQEDQKKTAASLLENAREICIRHGIEILMILLRLLFRVKITPEAITDVGDPKDAIREAVERLTVQLLVVGSHGRGALKRAFLGSVSNYCVHNMKCPVLVVKKP